MKTNPKKMILLVLAIAASAAGAQGQKKEPDPFDPLVGRWKTNDAKFASSTNEPVYADLVTNWTGKMYGSIKPSGLIIFKAENGCILSGMASPFASKSLWSITGRLEGCMPAHFNQRVFGNIRREGGEVFLEVKGVPFAVGVPPVGYLVTARMVLY